MLTSKKVQIQMNTAGLPIKVKFPLSPSFVVNTNNHSTNTFSLANSTSSTSPLNGISRNVFSTTTTSTTTSAFSRDMDSTTLLPPLKAPKSYGTYTKQQQEEVIAFIKDGNSLRTAEKIFGIPKSTMHCWLKKLQLETEAPSVTMTDVNKIDISTDEKLCPKVKRGTPQMSPPEKPRTQIVIEEAELIRFLQTDEGAELISKAYQVSVNDFRNFIKQSKQTKLKGNDSGDSPTTTSSRIQRSSTSSQTNNNTDRKRNFSDGDIIKPTFYTSGILDKRAKLESNNSYINRNSGVSDLVTLLTNNTEKKPIMNNQRSKKLVLTKEQLVTASKLIKNAQPGIVNTYLVTKPLVVNNQLTVPTNTLPTTLSRSITPKSDMSELSPTYPKMISPVSIKAERSEFDYMISPCSNEYSTSSPLVPKLQKTEERHFITTVSSNKSAALNLNEINRTQSEKELMALVDGDDSVSADELCADFGKSLDVNSWIDNENWYTDQYFQHFQVSPTSVTPATNSSYSPEASASSKSDFVLASVSSIDDLSSNAPCGITFTSSDDKEKIIQYIQDGHSLSEAVEFYNVAQDLIQQWFEERDLDWSDYETKPNLSALNQSRNARFESAFYRPTNSIANIKIPSSVNNTNKQSCPKSAFARAAAS